MRNKKERGFIVILCLSLLLLSGCQTEETGKSNMVNSETENPDKLVVYVDATSYSVSVGEDKYDFYLSSAMFGLAPLEGEWQAADYNVFTQALKNFEKETGISIEIHYFEEYTGKWGDLLQNRLDDDDMPDLMIAGKSNHYDYYRLAQQEMLLDFSPYVNKDEVLQQDEKYFQEVIDGGKLLGNQYAMPLLFNLNAFISSEVFLNRMGVQVSETDMTYEDILYLFERVCKELQNDRHTEALYASACDYMQSSLYLPSILTAAAYPSYFEGKDQDLVLTQEDIEAVLHLMKVFYEQELAGDLDYQSKSFQENSMYNGLSKSFLIGSLLRDGPDYIGIFLSGGREGSSSHYNNSLLTDTAYFQSCYQDRNEKMVVCGIPTKVEADTYSANIQTMVMGFQDTKYPETVYQLARYLMDYEYPAYYGFSVNRDITDKQLEEAVSTVFSIPREGMVISVGVDMQTVDNMNDLMINIDPLEKGTVTKIKTMLEHIAGSGVPYYPLEWRIYYGALELMFDENLTPGEAAERAFQMLKQYLEEQGDYGAFADERDLQLGFFNTK